MQSLLLAKRPGCFITCRCPMPLHAVPRLIAPPATVAMQSNWLLLMVRRPGCTNQDRAQTECPYDLMLTKVSWTRILVS